MKLILKLIICLAGIIMLGINTATAQTDFEKYRQQQRASFEEYTQQQRTSFADYVQQERERFKRYRDSLNREFAAFLGKEWKSFDLKQPEPLIKDPIPVPPVYDETVPRPKMEEIPIVKKPIDPLPQPAKPQILRPEPEPMPSTLKTIKATFFGTNIALQDIPISATRLTSVAEQEVARYWEALANMPYLDFMDEAIRLITELNLNGWGVYQLFGAMFDAYFPQGSSNERVIFTVFMLNQMSYRAKIAKSGNELIPLIAFQQDVSNCSYFMYGGNSAVKYSTLNPSRKTLSSILTCPADYADAKNNINLAISSAPDLKASTTVKNLTDGNNTFTLRYNKNMVDFYVDYPCVYFSVYAEAALDPVLLTSIEKQIAPVIAGKSQEDAVNLLLYFVQNAFEYKTDMAQFGYEKWNFAEETIASSYSDCEDRAILFTQLVRRLLKMPVVLVHYPGRHLATAVKFQNSATTGDYLMINGEKYLICDPTFIFAKYGMAMPDLRDVKVEIIRLRD